MQWIAVALGGAGGALVRFGVSRVLPMQNFPWGTLAVNVVGSFALAFLFRWGLIERVSPAHHALWTTGVCGALTTYSTFNLEVARLLTDGQPGRAAVYLSATVLICGASAFAAFWLAAKMA